MQSPEMMWEPFMDTSVPPFDLDGQPSLNASMSLFLDFGMDQATSDPVEDWLQGTPQGQSENDSAIRSTRALSTSAITPQINIDFAPPTRAQSPHPNSAISQGSEGCYQSPSLLPLDMRQRPRSPSPAQSVGSVGRIRSSSTGSMQRDSNLDLTDLRPVLTPQTNTQVRRHPETFQCPFCSQRFKRSYNLCLHLRTHTDERPYACSTCGKTFARQQDRTRHEELHHSGSSPRYYPCAFALMNGSGGGCGRTFWDVHSLIKHHRSPGGRSCILPLIEEETIQQQEAGINRQHRYVDTNDTHDSQPTMLHSLIGTIEGPVPAELVAKYDALHGVDGTTGTDEQAVDELCDQPDGIVSTPSRSRTSSFGGSSYDSTGYARPEYAPGIPRQASASSLQSYGSATSFSSRRGRRIPGGYNCSQCRLTFDVPSTLRKHEKSHLPKDQRPHGCPHCTERFTDRRDVNRHVRRIHQGFQACASPATTFEPASDETGGIAFEGDPFAPSVDQEQLDSALANATSSKFSPQQPAPWYAGFDSGTAERAEGQDLSTMLWEPSQASNIEHVQMSHQGYVETADLNLKETSDQADLPTIPRSKSAEILDLKKALDAAKREASLWRQERNFYAELLHENRSPDDISIALRFVHQEEVISPVRRARGWLGGIWGLLQTRAKTQGRDGDVSPSAAVTSLACQLARMEVVGSGRRGEDSESGRGSGSSSRVRASRKKSWREA